MSGFKDEKELKKTRRFNTLIHKHYKDAFEYPKLRHNLTRVRFLMNDVYLFRRMSANSQFEICVQITLISISTSRQAINGLSVISTPKNEAEYKYSMDYGYTHPKKISV